MYNITFSLSSPQFDLLFVKLNISFLKFTHLFNFIKIYYKTFVHIVKFSYAFSAKY